MRKVFLTIYGLVQIHSPQSDGQQVMISAEGTPLETYQMTIARHPHAESFSTYWLKHRTREISRQRLSTLINEAEEAFLKDGLEQARMRYELAFNARIDENWRTAEISMLRHAALRRAQIAESDQDQSQWLTRAAHVHTPEPIDEELFPPPLIQHYKMTLKKLKAMPMDLQSQFPWGEYLLVDGRVFPVSRNTRILKDVLSHRFTVISNRFAPVSEVLTWTGFQTWKPSPEPLAQGTCATNSLHPVLKSIPTKSVIWPVDCQTKPAQAALPPALAQVPSKPMSPTKSSELKRPLLVTIGLSMVLAAAAYHQMNQTNSRHVIPSDQDGF